MTRLFTEQSVCISARKRIIEHFSVQQMYEEIADTLNSLLEKVAGPVFDKRIL